MKIVLLVVLVHCIFSAEALECDSASIACANKEKCIPQRYICDQDDDCDDASDEETDLCSAWRNSECSTNQVKCTRNGNTECVSISTYCTSGDSPCEGDFDQRVCKILENGVLERLADVILVDTIDVSNLNKSNQLAKKFLSLTPHTLRHESCPPMYTLVGDQCLSIFHIGSMSWGEAREFCGIIGGDLITFRNISHFSSVIQHLQQFELTSDFWIGGRLENVTEGWIWVNDNAPMEMGSPYWATKFSSSCVERNVTAAESEKTCYHYYQAPEAQPKGLCVSLSFEQFFYMSDDDCVKNMSPLCVYHDEQQTFFR